MAKKKMKAIRIHEYGGTEVLHYETVPVPIPKQNEVLVRVHAAGVNPVDAQIRQGEEIRRGKKIPVKFDSPFPHILGWDVSGIVNAKGNGNLNFDIGDAVFGLVKFPKEGGTYAEYVACPVKHIAPKPKSINHVQAAGLPLTSLTAYQALFDTAGLSEGEKILIHGASGGVGHLAVQLAKWKGAYVIGTASSRNKEFVLGLGADEFIDYEKTHFENIVQDLDVVFDCVGGETQDRSWQILKNNGFLVTIRGRPSQNKSQRFGVQAKRILVKPKGHQLEEISELIDGDFMKPYISAIIPLRDAWTAHDLIQRGHTRGKIILQVASH